MNAVTARRSAETFARDEAGVGPGAGVGQEALRACRVRTSAV
jgi:hypothetical protein